MVSWLCKLWNLEFLEKNSNIFLKRNSRFLSPCIYPYSSNRHEGYLDQSQRFLVILLEAWLLCLWFVFGIQGNLRLSLSICIVNYCVKVSVCMCVYMCIVVSICFYVCVHIWMYMFFMYIRANLCKCKCARAFVWMCVCSCASICLRELWIQFN